MLLKTVPIGTKICIPGTKLEGMVISVNECRVVVKRTMQPHLVHFEHQGETREFWATSTGLESWAPNAEVEIVSE